MDNERPTPPPAQPRAPKPGFASRLFGYDIFLSFALGPPPRGTHSYASDLARRLRERDYSVFFSEDEAAPGEQLDSTLRNALLRSKSLVVIANRGTLAEPRWVRKEVEEFRQRHPLRPVIAINVGAALQDPALADSSQEWLGHQGKIWLDETEAAVESGIASDALINRLATAPARAKSNVRWRWLVRTASASLAALAIGAGYAAWQAKLNAEEANLQRSIALGNLQRALTGEKQATDNALRATQEASRAQKAETEALSQKGRAEQEAVRARQAETLAKQERAEAVFQSSIALSRQLAAQSGLVLAQSPDRLQLAVLLALESVEQHPTFEGSLALKTAASLLPNIERLTEYSETPERGRVRALTFSPDGAMLLAGYEDGAAKLIDVRRHKSMLLAHADAVIAVAFSQDGKLLATGSNDHTARLWNQDTGRERYRLEHGNAVSSVAFHPKLPWLATGSKDGQARVWSLTDGDLFWQSERIDAEVRAVAFSPDGRYLGTVTTGGCARVIELADQSIKHRWCFGDAGFGLAFSPDSKRLASANGSVAGVLDIESGDGLFEFTHLGRKEDGNPEHFKWIQQVAFSSDGRYLATAGRENTARVWDLGNGQEVVRLTHKASVEAVGFSPDGHQLITASWDGTTRLWDLPSGRELLRAGSADSTMEVAAFSPQGDLVVSGDSAGLISIWRLTGGSQTAQMRIDNPAKVLGIDAASKRIGAVDDKGNLHVWSASGNLLGTRPSIYGAKRLMFSQDGNYLAVQGGNRGLSLFKLDPALTPIELSGARGAMESVLGARYLAARDNAMKLAVWDIAGGKRLPAPGGDTPWEFVFDESGQHLAILSNDPWGKVTIIVRTLPSLRQTGRVPFNHKPMFTLAPGGTRLAVSGRKRKTANSPWQYFVDIVDVASGRPIVRINEERDLTFMRHSPDGKTLWTIGDPFSGQAHDLRIWDVASGRLLARLLHEHGIDKIRRSSRGGILATQSNGVIRIWEYVTGKLLGQLSTNEEITDFHLSQDGRLILSGNRKGEVSLDSWRITDLRQEACLRLTRNLSLDEWARYLSPAPYRATCQNLPVSGVR